jgi:hypothetical protein
MSKLTTLQGKDPKEVARLLSVVSRSLLPNPGIEDVIHQTGKDQEFVKAVISEIRGHLRISAGDQSFTSRSRVYSFLSEEISNAILTREAVSNVRYRLGDRGELHPSQYEVRFISGESVEGFEAAGNRKSNIVDAITHPDNTLHVKPKYLSEGRDPHLTISIKHITAKRADDRFTLLVLGVRQGAVLYVSSVYRVYHSEVNLIDMNDPLEVVRSFADDYGAKFSLGGKVAKLMVNEDVRLERSIDRRNPLPENVKIVGWSKGDVHSIVIAGGETKIKGAGDEYIGEVVLGFVVDLNKYVAALRRHRVNLSPDVIEVMTRTGSEYYAGETFGSQ